MFTIPNHATWKYGWRATTNFGSELLGATAFPVSYTMQGKERGDVISDPEQIAKELCHKNAEQQLKMEKEWGTVRNDDTLKEVVTWAMADNRLR